MRSAPVSSAVILPESELSKSPPTKRRRSSAAESTTKRPRLSEDAGSKSPVVKAESPEQPTAQVQERRKASVQEERKRGQRLFGGLLSTLSQTTPNNQNKRRQEIEKRQQERVKQQKAADEARKAEKLANLKDVRRTEQIKFDEQSVRDSDVECWSVADIQQMKVRHSNMLAMANFLSTRTEPKLVCFDNSTPPTPADPFSITNHGNCCQKRKND